jgi:hypothetical protein
VQGAETHRDLPERRGLEALVTAGDPSLTQTL